MRKLLKAFILFLDTRFPEKIVIPRASFVHLREDLSAASVEIEVLHDDLEKLDQKINKYGMDLDRRIAGIEESIKKLQDELKRTVSALGFMSIGQSPALHR